MNVTPKRIREEMKVRFPGTCPTCGQPEGYPCTTWSGRFLRSASGAHTTRKAS